MKIRSFFVVILLSLFIFPCSCKTDVSTMILDYGSKYGISEPYDDTPVPGDVDFNPKTMLLDAYCSEIDTFLEIPGPQKSQSYNWKFETLINHELTEDNEINKKLSLHSNVLLIDNPRNYGFEVGKTYFLTLTVTGGKGGKIEYTDRAIVLFYEYPFND